MIPTLALLALLASPPVKEPAVTVPAVDHAALLAEDLAREARGEPARYGVPYPVDGLHVDGLAAEGGAWVEERAGTLVWRSWVHAAGASSIDLGFFDLWLPDGAALTIRDGTGEVVLGPFTDRDNRPHGQLWTPVLPGADAFLELRVPIHLAPHVSLRVGQVNSGYRFYNEATIAKALACNVDVACPEGDPYRAISDAVVMYTSGSGAGICTGALINNVRGDKTPYVLTARHCGVSPSSAPSLVFYFGYESPTCRTGPESGRVLPRSLARTVSGARVVAEGPASDFELLELEAAPPNPAFLAGWDRRDVAPAMAVGIHHPRTHEKRIAIEFDPLVTGEEELRFFSPALAPGSYWEVLEWDVGITEQGSSGSPLFDADQRIVGQLAGGSLFSCPGAEEGPDYYGKLTLSWDTGQTPETRLADWLDPDATGVAFLDGIPTCEPPTVVASASQTLVGVGELIDFSAEVAGGEAPYSYAWDFDGDGVVDSTLPSPQVRYPELPTDDGRVTVRVRVDDAQACPGEDQVALVVEGPQLFVTAGEPVERCGDGDDRVERGELWSLPFTVANGGTRPATGAVAAFALDASDTVVSAPDAFGYVVTDSTGFLCTWTDVDLTGAADVTPVDTDDDATVVALGGGGFDFYGERLDAVAFSTNGYLSGDPGDGGGDFTNDCPLPRPPAIGEGPRIMPFHDDLVVDGALRHGSYETCPRPADAGPAAQACDAFEWSSMSYFTNPSADFDVQAFLYPETGALAFQYRGNDPRGGSGATIAIQNRAGDVASTYACNESDAVVPERAICFYPPGTPLAVPTVAELATPSVAIGTLAPGGSRTVEASVLIGDEAPCGVPVTVRFLGVGHDAGFQPPAAGDAATLTISDEPCARAGDLCPLPLRPEFLPRTGFWLNPDRPGTGLDLHLSPTGGVYGAWYTARADLTPTWYYLQTLAGTPIVGGRIEADVLAFENAAGAPAGGTNLDAEFRVVGHATFTFLAPDLAHLAWTIDGQPGGELITFLSFGEGPVAGVTDQWFSAASPGWGVGIQQQALREFAAIYFYGDDGRPAWVVTVDPASLATSGASPVSAFQAHCPGCVWTTPRAFPAGLLERVLDGGSGTGALLLDIAIDDPVPIHWQSDVSDLRAISPAATTKQR